MSNPNYLPEGDIMAERITRHQYEIFREDFDAVDVAKERVCTLHPRNWANSDAHFRQSLGRDQLEQFVENQVSEYRHASPRPFLPAVTHRWAASQLRRRWKAS